MNKSFHRIYFEYVNILLSEFVSRMGVLYILVYIYIKNKFYYVNYVYPVRTFFFCRKIN